MLWTEKHLEEKRHRERPKHTSCNIGPSLSSPWDELVNGTNGSEGQDFCINSGLGMVSRPFAKSKPDARLGVPKRPGIGGVQGMDEMKEKKERKERERKGKKERKGRKGKGRRGRE